MGGQIENVTNSMTTQHRPRCRRVLWTDVQIGQGIPHLDIRLVVDNVTLGIRSGAQRLPFSRRDNFHLLEKSRAENVTTRHKRWTNIRALDTWRSRDLRSAECASLTTKILHNSPLQSVSGVWNLRKKNWLYRSFLTLGLMMTFGAKRKEWSSMFPVLAWNSVNFYKSTALEKKNITNLHKIRPM